MKKTGKSVLASFLVLALGLSITSPVFARSKKVPSLSARSAVVIDSRSGSVLYGKNTHLKLPPASTTKVMTVLLALERLPLRSRVKVSRNAVNASPSKAGLTLGASYRAIDLIVAALVSSSNDAAVALAEAVGGTEANFVKMMNQKAHKLGMVNTKFINSTGLPDPKKRKQYTTTVDLARMMRYAARDERIDSIMGIRTTVITGSDGRAIPLRSHNKMLWKKPLFVKGKTGWTFASRHTFVGTNYAAHKKIMFALLSSKEPWVDIERLATHGLRLKAR